ncbi:MAG: hypothetical protein AABX12_03670 [Nanoarchaeota archaeon]
MTYTPARECISAYVASALSMAAGTSVSLCDSRGASTDEFFTLRGVPEGMGLGTISNHIADYHGLDRSLVSPSATNDAHDHKSILHVGGRIRIPHASIKVTRQGHRVLVDIASVAKS